MEQLEQPIVDRSDPAAASGAFNLVLNAMDAVPQGGTLILRTSRQDENAHQVSDTGNGSKECERLFAYYTNRHITQDSAWRLCSRSSMIMEQDQYLEQRGTTFDRLPGNMKTLLQERRPHNSATFAHAVRILFVGKQRPQRSAKNLEHHANKGTHTRHG
jgi:hypothetical protein